METKMATRSRPMVTFDDAPTAQETQVVWSEDSKEEEQWIQLRKDVPKPPKNTLPSSTRIMSTHWWTSFDAETNIFGPSIRTAIFWFHNGIRHSPVPSYSDPWNHHTKEKKFFAGKVLEIVSFFEVWSIGRCVMMDVG